MYCSFVEDSRVFGIVVIEEKILKLFLFSCKKGVKHKGLEVTLSDDYGQWYVK
jgi:hypothetical protein